MDRRNSAIVQLSLYHVWLLFLSGVVCMCAVAGLSRTLASEGPLTGGAGKRRPVIAALAAAYPKRCLMCRYTFVRARGVPALGWDGAEIFDGCERIPICALRVFPNTQS